MSDEVEWSSPAHETCGVELNERGWPILRSSDAEPCEGRNPVADRACVRGHHNGYHRDSSGAEWLDD